VLYEEKLKFPSFKDPGQNVIEPKTFEDWNTWLNDLSGTIVNLGLQLSAHGSVNVITGSEFGDSEAYIPCAIILHRLEQVAAMLTLARPTNPQPKGWAAKCLFDMNIPHKRIVISYQHVLEDIKDAKDKGNYCLSLVGTADQHMEADSEFRLQVLESSFAVISEWFKNTLSSSLQYRSSNYAVYKSELQHFCSEYGLSNFLDVADKVLDFQFEGENFERRKQNIYQEKKRIQVLGKQL
jgi:hypothetical protein